MKGLRQKEPRIRLSLKDYEALQKRVLARDGWRCQSCGSPKNLHVHHMKPRSELGGDVMSNLITLCVNCHEECHTKRNSPGS